MLEEIFASTLRMAIPLIFVSYGGLLSERSGVANIGLEAQLSASAFAAAAATALWGSILVGVAAGFLGALIIALVFAFFCIHGRGNDIVVGTAINILALGILPVLTKSLFGITGSTPSLPLDLRIANFEVFAFLAVTLCFGLNFILRRTVWGLRVNAAGENPNSLITQGVSAIKMRYQAVLVGSMLSAIGGIYLSLCQSSSYVRNMSAGRGFMALAALILGSWKPIPTACACLIFAAFDAIQIRLQFIELIPNQFIQILPFIVTLLGLALFGGKMLLPRAINQKL